MRAFAITNFYLLSVVISQYYRFSPLSMTEIRNLVKLRAKAIREITNAVIRQFSYPQAAQKIAFPHS